MSVAEVRYYLERVTRRYRTLRTAELVVCMAAIVTVTIGIGIAIPWIRIGAFAVGVIAAALFGYLRARQLKLFSLTSKDVVRYINRSYPELEESGDLFLEKDEDLTIFEKLQCLRSAKHFSHVESTLKLPSKLRESLLMLVGSVLLAVLLLNLSPLTLEEVDESRNGNRDNVASSAPLPVDVKSVSIEILPPAYTGLEQKKVTAFPLTAAESSTVRWSIQFTNKPATCELILYGRDTLGLKETDNGFAVTSKLDRNGFYQVAWKTADDSLKISDYYKIEIIRDNPPVVKVDNLEQFIQLMPTDNLNVHMKSTLADDYGLRDGYVIATVSKGSGESVKFREEKLSFSSPSLIQGKRINASLMLDLKKLGLDPGDELYFYVEACDKRTPKANRARTETYFIAIRDTSEMTTSVDPGLGVDLLPEYFRSQRQIIIDTEKLLKEKSKISQQQFKSKSNELGHDEKILRMRYAEFLGDEFSGTIGPAAGPSDNDHEEEDVTKAYGHAHDTDKEHDDVAPSHQHGHQENGSSAGEKLKEDPSKEYMHAHDSEEEATFFTMSIRAKLKAAVAVMWDAELHLRMYEPTKSLPYQYRALKLLKEISQDSRIYVHRTGFDPPPLKEEKRLTGELTDAKNSQRNVSHDPHDRYPAIRAALSMLEHMQAVPIPAKLRSALLGAGNELAAIALEQPGKYLKTLSLLKALSADEIDDRAIPEAVEIIKGVFIDVLPEDAYSPQASTRAHHPLEEQFIDEMSPPTEKRP